MATKTKTTVDVTTAPIEEAVSNEPRAQDEVYPIFSLDDTGFNQRNLSWVMRFNDVLDADLLHKSLVKLLSTGDWRKLAGRIRRNNQGKLEAHAPTSFDSLRPAVDYTHVKHDTLIEEDAAARFMPKPTEGVSIQPLTARLRAFEARKELGAKVKTDAQHDEPQLSLHITTFRNGTIVALTTPHLSTDAIGLAGLFQNWSRIVNGKEAEVSPVVGARADEMISIDGTSDEKAEPGSWDMEHLQLRGKKLKLLILKMLVELLFGSPKQKKILYCPKEKIQKITELARKEAAETFEAGGYPSAFISETDVLTAWVTHLLVTSDPRSNPVTVAGALNARFRFANVLSKGVHLQNMVGSTYTLLSPAQARKTVGSIALRHRECVQQQSTEAQFRAQLATARRLAETKAKELPFFGSHKAAQIKVNSMIRVDLFGAIDFSGAVVAQETVKDDATRKNPPGTMIFWYNKLRNVSLVPLDFFFMQGKDAAGDYWFMANLPKRTWSLLKKELHQL